MMRTVDAFIHKGQRYDRDGFRELLQRQMQAARADPADPYNDSKHPQRAAAVADMRNAYRWLGGEVGEDEERDIAGAVNEALRGETEVTTEMRPELGPVHRMNQIASTTEGRVALQRDRLRQALTPSQAALVSEYRALEQAHNAAVKPVYTGGTFKTGRPHTLPRELYGLEKIADPRERLHGIREMRAQMRDDKASAFNNANHPEHRNAIEQMRRLYDAEQEIGPLPEDPE
jgi:hypothetical protein